MSKCKVLFYIGVFFVTFYILADRVLMRSEIRRGAGAGAGRQPGAQLRAHL